MSTSPPRAPSNILGTVAVPLSEVTAGKQLDLPLLAATLAPWPRKHGAPSLQVTFDMVYADNVRSAREPRGFWASGLRCVSTD